MIKGSSRLPNRTRLGPSPARPAAASPGRRSSDGSLLTLRYGPRRLRPANRGKAVFVEMAVRDASDGQAVAQIFESLREVATGYC